MIEVPPDTFRADLHCHTTCSDGTKTPEDVIKLAASIGLKGLSITDHDTVDAYLTAFDAARDFGVDLISGVEFSCMHKGVSVHMLAYAFPVQQPLIQDLCLRHRDRRLNRNRSILELLDKAGMPISEKDVLDSHPNKNADFERSIIGRPHIALAMLEKNYVSSLSEAFNKFLGEKCPCYVPGTSFSVEETLDLVHRANGLAVIAHPHLVTHTGVLKDLLDMPFDGVECFYARFQSSAHKRWLKIAAHRKWLVTGGSDFHGDIKPNNPLGASWVDEERFNILKDHFNKVSREV
jgi:hypothetical protein